jgi:hypothetical protein
MNANELADWIKNTEFYNNSDPNINDRMDEVEAMLRQQQQRLTKYELRHEEQRKRIEELEAKIERMIENQSHYEAMEHAAGFEAGRKLGMQQERALWQLAASTQEIEKK